jgi:hypothetical protein
MFHRWAALLLVLALCAMSPKTAAGQSKQQPRGQSAGSLGKNYPNPFNPETSIRFAVDTVGGCLDGSRQHVVTLRIVNILQRPVTHFVLRVDPNSVTSVSSSLLQQPILNMRLGCGVYVGYWSGNLPNGKEAASGVYLAQMFIDGAFVGPPVRMFNSK